MKHFYSLLGNFFGGDSFDMEINQLICKKKSVDWFLYGASFYWEVFPNRFQ